MAGLRVMLGGFLMVTLAVPALFVFEGMTAVNSIFLSRQTWYDVMAEPALHAAFIDEIRAVFPESSAQREVILAAISPAYVQSQFNRLVDYAFNVLNGVESGPPTFDVPAPLAAALRENPNATQLDIIEGQNGVMQLTVNISERSLAQVRGLASQYTIALIASGLIGLGIWILAAILAVDGARARLLWLGGGLILASFIVLMVGLAFNTAFTPLITQRLTQNNAELEAASRAVMDGLAGVLPRFATALIVAGGIPFAIGLILLVMGASLRPRQSLRESRYPLA